MYQHVSNVSTSAASRNGAFIPGADAPSSTQNQFISRVALRHVFWPTYQFCNRPVRLRQQH
jgi:hypothetical protein